MIFSRGLELSPIGSVEDRVMRETIFRERREKVSFLEAITKVVARMHNVDADKAFGSIVADYAGEVFQEAYDADLLKLKVDALRRAQATIRAKRQSDLKALDRLERMGAYYDKVLGEDLKPLPKGSSGKPVKNPRGK